MEKQKTISVVGGGIGGLASAILLARQGYKVSVYEKNECLGGRASIMHKNGYTFDMGPSRYLMPDVFEEFFKSIDEDIHDRLDLKQLSPSYRVFYDASNALVVHPQTQENEIEITTYDGKICCSCVGLFGFIGSEIKRRDGVLAIIKNTSNGKFLFQKKKRAYDVITLCGGGIEEGESKEETILREVREETGLQNPKLVCKLGDTSYLNYRKGKDNLFGSNDFYYIEVESNEHVNQISDEELSTNENIWLEEKDVIESINFYSHLIGWFRYKEFDDGTGNYEKADAEFLKYCQESGYCYEFNSIHKTSKDTIPSLAHIDIYADKKAMASIFESMETGSGKQFLTFLERSKEQYEIGMEFCKKNYDSLFDFFRWDIMRKGMKLNIRTTIDKYVARYFKSEIIQKIMQYSSVFLGTAPKSTPALYNIMSHADYNMGVRYPKGGIHQIAQVLHEIGLKYGVEYHLNTEIVGCEIEDNQIINLKSKRVNSDKLQLNNKTSGKIISLNKERRQEYKSLRLKALQTDPEAFGGSYDEAKQRDEEYRKNRLISNTNTLLFLENEEAKLMGTINYSIENGAAKIYGTYVDPSHRGLGGASKLLNTAVEKILEAGISSIDLRVYSTQHGAIKLYEKEGFTIFNTNKEEDGKEFFEMSYKEKKGLSNTISSDIYVINADMAWFETNILPAKEQTYPKSYRDKKVFAPSGFIIFAGINKKLPKLDHHNLYFCEDWDKNFGQIFDSKELPSDPSIYVSKITHTDSGMAPDGCENLFILVPIPNGIDITDSQKKLYKDQIWKIVEHMAGENIVGHVEVEEIFAVNDFASRYHAWNGTALGLAHPIMQTAVFRPNNISKKLNNLFYVGHNTNPGIGVPMVLISAGLVAERIKNSYH